MSAVLIVYRVEAFGMGERELRYRVRRDVGLATGYVCIGRSKRPQTFFRQLEALGCLRAQLRSDAGAGARLGLVGGWEERADGSFVVRYA